MLHKMNKNVCRRLARAIQVALRIPDGEELVFLIGHGNETTNLQALETWVSETLPQLDDEWNRAMLPALMARLEQTINHGGTW
ncbi:MAG: hypothetical protein M0P11_09440 [Anaerolineaceae bacterium]|nr:hypothetical protein [Anaerolineaceae bacterium]